MSVGKKQMAERKSRSEELEERKKGDSEGMTKGWRRRRILDGIFDSSIWEMESWKNGIIQFDNEVIRQLANLLMC